MYTITHGNIACIQTIKMPDGTEADAIYIREGRTVLSPPALHDENKGAAAYAALPAKVRAAIDKQFAQVFAMPVFQRAEWVKAQVPCNVEAE